MTTKDEVQQQRQSTRPAPRTRWEMTVCTLLGEQPPPLPSVPGRACRGTYGGPNASDLLRLQVEAAAAIRPGWKRSRPAASGSLRQW